MERLLSFLVCGRGGSGECQQRGESMDVFRRVSADFSVHWVVDLGWFYGPGCFGGTGAKELVSRLAWSNFVFVVPLALLCVFGSER